jgi:dienelactone hydrolase
MKNTLYMVTVIVLMMLALGMRTAQAASLSDLDKEQRWQEQILSSLMMGEDVELRAGGVKFLALYAAAASKQAKGAVILIHGRGAHPAWPDVIEPLRIQLAEHGWHTLSLQMPVLRNAAEDKDYIPLMPEVPLRIQAGVDFLKSNGITNIILAGHSTGATMASYYLAGGGDPAVKTFVIISGGPGVVNDTRMDSVKNYVMMEKLNILDIIGSEDLDFVSKTATKRQKLAGKNQSNHYASIKIPGADHFYRGQEDVLANKVSAWLDKNR